MSQDMLVCPVCETENDALQRMCVNCGQSLIAVCPSCNAVNAITAGQCSACGQRLDTLGQIIARHEVRFEERITRQAAIETRAEQKDKDQARSRQLWEQERQRQNWLADQLQRRKAQERRLMFITAAVAIIVVAIILLSALAR